MNTPNGFALSAIERLSSSIYVVLIKVPVKTIVNGKQTTEEKLTLVGSPGEEKPWSHKNKRVADLVAKENNGMAVTWKEAFALLLKEYPGFHDELLERLSKAKTDTIKQALDTNSLKHGINTNAHRNEDGTILGADGKPAAS